MLGCAPFMLQPQTRDGKSVQQQLVQCCARAYPRLREDQAQAAQEHIS